MTSAIYMSSNVLLRRLLRDYVMRCRGRLWVAIGCMVLVAAATAGNAWVMQPALDQIFMQRNAQMLVLIPLAVVALALVNGVAGYGQNVMMRYIGQRVIADMQLDLFAHLMRSDLKLFHDQASGRLISRFTNDINIMRYSISNVLTGVARETVTAVFLIGVMFYQSWQLSLMALIGFPIAVMPIVRLGRRMRKVSDNTQAQLGEFTAQLDDSFQGVRVVKAYGREAFEYERARTTIEKLFTLYYKAARVQMAAAPIMELLAGVAIASVIWYGGYQVIAGHTTPGAFFSFMTAMLMAYKPAKNMANLNTNLQEGLAAARRFYEVIDTLPSISDAPDAKAIEIGKGHIVLEEVSFAYDAQHPALQQVSLQVQPGSTVALVGASGGGKSTLINLILRFYDVASGRILIDGQDIRTVTLASLRQHIALVSQEVVLFDDTVRANIAYGRLQASEDEIVAAAKQAAAHEFIIRLPQGYDTMIGPHGVKLSGGQRQRLSIARAILKNAPILLLDEATSALDSESEQSIQKALEELMRGRTTIVIAHRLSTVQHANVIYVMDGGCVVEAGSHADLLQRKGRYHQLYSLQYGDGRQSA